jgi:hypothetical protein
MLKLPPNFLIRLFLWKFLLDEDGLTFDEVADFVATFFERRIVGRRRFVVSVRHDDLDFLGFNFSESFVLLVLW